MDRIANSSLNQEEYLEENSTLQSYPTIINLQTNYSCNARCVYCEINGLNKKNFESGIMPMELIKKNISLFERAKYVELSVTGEPFLYPYLEELAELLAASGVQLFITTNGLSVNEDTLKVILPFTKSITISVDGPNTNARTRGYRFEEIVPTLDLLSSYNKEYDFNLNLSAVVTKINLEDSLKLLDIAEKYRCKNIIYTRVLFLKEELKPDYQPARDDFVRFLENLYRIANKYTSLRVVNTLQRVENWHCPALWRNLYLFPCGDILACCVKNELMGNINKQPFEQIWNGPKYVALRKDYRRTCSDCMHILLSKHSFEEAYDRI